MPMGEDPNRRGGSRRWIIHAVETRCAGSAPTGSTSTRSPPRPGHRHDETLGALTDLVQQGKVRSIGSSSFSAAEIVEAQWTGARRHLALPHRAAALFAAVRGIELDVLPTAQRHGMGILTYSPLGGGWLSGSWTADSSPTSPARQRLAARFDMSLPENQRKLEAVEQLAAVADDAGLSLIELAIAFVVNHRRSPRRSSGRARWSSSTASSPPPTSRSTPRSLDRIDEIVKPGVNLNPADTSYGEQVLAAGSAAAVVTPALSRIGALSGHW